MQFRYAFALTVGVAFMLSNPAFADKRIALVIGNGAYETVARLDNPINDAKLIADTLRGLGFNLIGGGALTNLDKAGMDNAIANFGSQVVGADVGLFYYAGHGVQVRNSNYLVPINANPAREADVYVQMTDIAVVLSQMEGSGTKLNLVILDACRNNPFGGRGLRSTDSGLAQIRAPEGTLISYATQPGNVAKDGADGNSPYTKALAQTIRRSGLDIFQTFNEVGLAVKRATGGDQQPWVSNSPIDGSFYFSPQSTQSPTIASNEPAQQILPPQKVYTPTVPAPEPSTPAAVAPSFSCSVSLSPDEQAICNSPRLASLDRQLATAFSTAKSASGDQSSLMASERAWVSRRKLCSTDENCIAAQYTTRIAELSAGNFPAIGPSFSCGGKLATDERAICENPRLSALDRQLRSAFDSAKNRYSQSDLIRDQKNWLNRRSACLADATCIEALYRERISQLNR